MKTSYYFKLTAALLSASALTVASCSDDWKEHYEETGALSPSDQPSLFALVTADRELSQFARVLAHTGYDKVLASSQTLTLWAPVITEAQADSVINLYDTQKRSLITMPDGSQRYIEDKDNKAITQFIQNHIALYGHSVSNSVEDSVLMLNGKYMILKPGSLNGIAFASKNVVANNGIFYKLQGKQNFTPNVRESLSLFDQLSGVSSFFEELDRYELDESASVERGVINGRKVYADSVLVSSNPLYSSLGWINREDSSYLFLAPSNEVWEREYQEFLPYFNYVNYLENRDSVARMNAHFAIISGRMFNLNQQRSPMDSIINTRHVNYSSYYGLNVFDRPYSADGILYGLAPWTCSNGQVMIDTEGRIDYTKTFLEARYILATNRNVRTTPQINVNGEAQPQVSVRSETVIDTITFDGKFFEFKDLKEKVYMEMAPISYSVANPNSSMYFYLQNTLSNLYYNVYVVIVPAFANSDGYHQDDLLPTSFEVSYNERLADRRTNLGTNPNEDEQYSDPARERSIGSFQVTGQDVEVFCIDKARKPAISGYNFFGSIGKAAMRYRISTNVRSSELNKKTKTNVLRINRLIYIPFKTEEEANAYELDLSNLKEFNVGL